MMPDCRFTGEAWPRGPSERPYLKFQRVDDRWLATGTHNASFGQRIEKRGEAYPLGTFAGWDFDGESCKAEVDRFGVYPLYYHSDANSLIVSDSIMTLLANGASRSVDWEALAVLFWWGALLGDDTPFTSIRMLPPGGSLEWRDGQFSISSPVLRVSESRMTLDGAIDGFIDLVAAAVADRPGEHSVVPLSGGRDSRHLLLRLVESGRLPDLCITARYGEPSDLDEVEVSQAVARRVGVPHRIVHDAHCRVRAEGLKNALIGFTSPMHYWYDSVVRGALDAGVRTVYDGLQMLPFAHPGWSDPEKMRLFEVGQFQSIAREWICPEGTTTNGWMRFLAPEYRNRIAPEVAVARLMRELGQFASWPNPLGAFIALNRMRRAVGNQLHNFWPANIAVYCPFYDHRLFEHLLSLPPSLTMEGDFHTHAIHRAFPNYADIPFTGRVRPRRDPPRQMSSARRLLWWLVRYGPGPLLQTSHVIPRALRAALDPRYAPNIDWIAPKTVFLWQLGHVVSGDEPPGSREHDGGRGRLT